MHVFRAVLAVLLLSSCSLRTESIPAEAPKLSTTVLRGPKVDTSLASRVPTVDRTSTSSGSRPTVPRSVGLPGPVPVLAPVAARAEEAVPSTPEAEPPLGTAPAEERAEVAPAAPAFQPLGGVFAGPVTVQLAAVPEGVQVVYTLDGTTPTPGKSPVYSGPFVVPGSALVKAVAYRPSGLASGVATEDFTIGEVCVNGGQAGNGTRTRPFNTLAQAVDAAVARGIGTVKVGLDPLDESREITVPLTYLGGWNRSFTERTGRSVVNGLAMVGGDKRTSAYGWKISGTQASGVHIDGFEIHGGKGSYSAALVVTQGASPRITNSVFVGGPGQYGYGALVLSRSSPTFESCVLVGGAAPSCFGLAIDDSEAVLRASRASAGSGTVTGAGVSVTSGKVQVVGSLVAGNAANTAYGVALFNSRGTRIESSTVWGGNGRKATAVFVSEGDPAIVSSTLAAQGSQLSYGVNQNYGKSAPSLLNQVVFEGCATALYHNVNSQTDYTKLGPGGAFVTETGLTLSLPLASDLSLRDLPNDAPWSPVE